MKTGVIFLLSLSLALMTSCQETKVFGETFDSSSPIEVEQLLVKLDESGSVDGVVVKGMVEDVCQVKGCWMTLITDDGNSMRVTFKDYGFFVPKDLNGKVVVIKGMGEITTTSVADLQHYAGDNGQSEEEINAITEPLDEYVFVADGVVLVD